MMRSERPTIPPAFDVEEYARESDQRVAHARSSPRTEVAAPVAASQPQSGPRIISRPSVAAALGDEAWAHKMSGAPVLDVSPKELKLLPLDHRAGYLLSLMDGSLDLETLVSVSAMPRDATLRLVRELHSLGVIRFA